MISRFKRSQIGPILFLCFFFNFIFKEKRGTTKLHKKPFMVCCTENESIAHDKRTIC